MQPEPTPTSARDAATLITGATGMVGSAVLARCLARGQRCAVLVRDSKRLSANERIEQILCRFESAWQQSLPRPIVFRGDLLSNNLGLESEDLQWVRHQCDAILHSAASLSFAPASENSNNEPFRTNVAGTEEVLRVARACEVNRLYHVSTAYVCGTRSGKVLESDLDVGQDFANDYERSKVQAETILRQGWQADSRSRLTVFRPSIVVDPLGLTPVSSDRTIYGAHAMYRLLAGRFGLPRQGDWMRNLGFAGDECKNLVDVHWIANVISSVVCESKIDAWVGGKTLHLTAELGTRIDALDRAFHQSMPAKLARRNAPARDISMDELAAPFVETFRPYFRDDPSFDRTQIDSLIERLSLPRPPAINETSLLEMIDNWTSPNRPPKDPTSKTTNERPSPSPSMGRRNKVHPKPAGADVPQTPDDTIVLCGFDVRLPGGVNHWRDFETLLFEGRSAIGVLPKERLDRELYFDRQPGLHGKTYTEIGGWVDAAVLDPSVDERISQLGDFDITHRQFARVAASAMRSVLGDRWPTEVDAFDGHRAGVFVGHSGGTEHGGDLALATLAPAATRFLAQPDDSILPIDASTRNAVRHRVVDAIQRNRPSRNREGGPEMNAYAAASLTARLLAFRGRREVIDAACSSSLIALQHAASAIRGGSLDVAIVGGATYNNVDNLALFSKTQACSATGSFPFDQRASGLVSSEGYVAVVIARADVAHECGMPILAELVGVGVSSDGKGKGLWAPRSEGQTLAIRRATDDQPLSLDYLECHATSTQVGDATELESLNRLSQHRSAPLAIGSVKSNLGHLLEAAGMVGLVKCLISMRRNAIPPSIHFEQPTESFPWHESKLRVVAKTEPWPNVPDRESKTAAVDAFGIGGLNAHAVIRERSAARLVASSGRKPEREPLAIVGRGLVLPSVSRLNDLEALLQNGRSVLRQAPEDRWPQEFNPATGKRLPIGVRPDASPGRGIPHAVGGYIERFQFDAQSYRIPPKLVANANPAQLMLIEAVRQAADEFDGGEWTIDRERTSVVIGTMFGGQFSNELQIGLRLPEIIREIRRAAMESGLDERFADRWAEEFRESALKAYPALLDETGGFTASTLASRIARTFDLMGGACAVDADESSSGLALLTAAEQLASGSLDMVICGTAGRSMDLVAFEQLYNNGRLANPLGPTDPAIEEDSNRRFPCEGVGVVFLQRLRDAKKSDRPILGVIDGWKESYTDEVTSARRQEAQPPSGQSSSLSSRLASQIGHLGGGHGLLQAIAATVADVSPTHVRETASDGYQIGYQVGKHVMKPESTRTESTPRTLVNNVMNSPVVNDDVLTVRIESETTEGLIDRLEQITSDPVPSKEHDLPFNPMRDQAVLVGDSMEALSATARELLGLLTKFDSRHGAQAAVKNAGFYRRASGNLDPEVGSRSAWLCPGQGSQYASAPAAFEFDPHCWSSIDAFDSQLQSLGLEAVRHRLADPNQLLGKDIWWTQLWLLATSTALVDSLRRRGLRPDVVLGHSFGECTAAWVAGSMSLRDAIRFARARSEAVTLHGGPRGELLSIRSEPSRVLSVLQASGSHCVITHHNAPLQTVIAGTPAEIATAKAELSQAGLAAVRLSVPAAFHTPDMQAARDVLKVAQRSTKLRPPSCGYLSAISNRYLAEPEDIRHNLVDQLIRPVGFASALNRLVEDGCGLIIEVGPNNILTRLANATLSGRAVCLSADHPNLPPHVTSRLIELATACFGGSMPVPQISTSVTQPKPMADTFDSKPHAVVKPANRFQVVDVTRRGRRIQPSVNDSAAPALRSAMPSQRTTPHQAPVNSPVTMPVADVKDQASSTPSSPTTTNSANAARDFLFDLVVDLTGYEPEIIDFDADLEAELGVDSIKRAQLIGELLQWADCEVSPEEIKLAQFASMNDILALIPKSNSDVESVINPPSFTNESAVTADSDLKDSDLKDSDLKDSDSLRQLMIDLVVDQTGYDESIIEMDADLESELGIDSIKRAQLLGELEQHFDLPPLQQSDLRLADFPTLNSIHQFILQQLSGNAAADGRAAADGPAGAANESLPVKKKSHFRTTDSVADPADVAPDVPADGTHRFALRMAKSPRLDRMPNVPRFSGAAIVYGENPIANELTRQLRRNDVEVHAVAPCGVPQLEETLQSIWSDRETPHLFLTSPHDAEATWAVDDVQAFRRRKTAAIESPYRLCQLWMQRMIDQESMSRASLVTLVRGGGDFGISLDESDQRSSESGALAGLTKAMLIEAWMRGFRETPMLVIDSAPKSDTPGSNTSLVEEIFCELATPSYEEEVTLAGGNRSSVAVRHAPLGITADATDDSRQFPTTRFPLSRGGNWLVAGGGRGITAMSSMALAERYGLKLHLLGMAAAPELDEATREFARRDRMGLRRETMRQVQQSGENPVKHWRQFEKAIEIDATLQECKRRRIAVEYHSVDISDAEAVEQLVNQIRKQDGPIRGVIQGAGSGQDARFDRKRADKVRQCLSAKIDGTIALAHATRNDPLEWFVGFGSISGRFGANGHTDYSAANDMLAKLIGDLGRKRASRCAKSSTNDPPRCLTFHWHAWGDVGMATKPEAKLALDMIGMNFMPAAEGLQHFLAEFSHGGDRSEVLITDRRYIRKFIPVGEDDRPFATPLLLREKRWDDVLKSQEPQTNHVVTLNPVRDAFLSEHRVSDRPTLPMVVALELLSEAAWLHEVEKTGNPSLLQSVRGLRALTPLKSVTQDPFAVELLLDETRSRGALDHWRLVCDLRRRDGRIVEAQRPHFEADFEFTPVHR
ncbi:MAG: SDR family NAD(P)-dependent oxidoreductase [Planctomycetota bacterium]